MHAADELMTPAMHSAPAKAASRTMRAIVHPEYGTPDVLVLDEIERPVPGDDDVLVRVHAANVSVGDHHMVTGKPYLIRLSPYGGLPRPRNRVPGTTMSGRVEAVGKNVTTFEPGDDVYGEAMSGAFAEYIVVPAKLVAPKPENLSFEEAAASPWGVTALQGLRDSGGLEAGQSVLINGASGGVGTWAVQIAKALGAEVTAVCSTRHVELVRGLGADEVIDYTERDFVTGGSRFDLIFDTVGNRTLSEYKSVLGPEGTYVACAGGGGDWFGPIFWLLGVLVSSWFTRRKLTTFVTSPNAEDLRLLKELVEADKARPVIERVYALNEVGEALRHVGAGHSQGQNVVRVVG